MRTDGQNLLDSQEREGLQIDENLLLQQLQNLSSEELQQVIQQQPEILQALMQQQEASEGVKVVTPVTVKALESPQEDDERSVTVLDKGKKSFQTPQF